MKYFAIEKSLNEKILGRIDQVKEFIHHCNIIEEINFIDKFILERIDTQPILSNAVLYSNAKQTDFIDTLGDIGFNFSYLISDKLRKILDNFNCYGFQFFKSYIIQNNKKIDSYWQAKIYNFPFQYINFEKTTVSLRNGISNEIISESLEINNLQDFQNKIENLKFPYSISISSISFNKNMNLDFFNIRFLENGSSKGIVSERLKKEIEKQGCTGIEFRPIEISLQEWYHRGEREKVYGKV